MVSTRPISWWPIAALLIFVAGVLGWLLLGFAGDRTGWVPLPNREATLVFLPGQKTRLTRAAVERRPAEAWRHLRQDRPASVFVERTELWLKVTLRNPGSAPLHGVLADVDYFIDRLDVWVSGDVPGSWQELRSGEAVPMREKALWGRDVAFPITVPAGGERVIYLRGDDNLLTEVQLGWWARAADFHAMQARGLLAEGLYLGGLLALLGYNTILWLRLRLTDMGWYVLYLGSTAAFMFLARAHVPGLGWALGSPGLEIVLTLTMALNGVFLIGFAREFLGLKSRSRWTNVITRGMQAIMLGLAVLALATPWLKSMLALALVIQAMGVTHVTLLGISLWAWRTGSRQARFFALSYGCLFAGSLPTVAIWMWNPAHKHAAMMGLMVGSALEMLLLSLALADRFAQAQQEKAAAQAKLVEETEQRRAVEEAYADELAVEVRERTRELEVANADKDRVLTVIGHDLRGPLAGLTQTAEQLTVAPADRAALGQFVGDTAKLGRQVLLLIEDLVLWARLRTGEAHPPARHDVRAIVAPVMALHRAIANRRGVDFTVAVTEELHVATDLVLAQTLLRNLVANALKFARSEVTVSAHVRPAAEGGGARLTVRDDGPGLPPTVLAGLASATEATPEAAGLTNAGMEGGLGLRLCVEISRALGAKLAVMSVAGGGTEFSFVLPAAGAVAEKAGELS